MNIIKQPSVKQLEYIQNILQKENLQRSRQSKASVGIVDIYGNIVTDYLVAIESGYPVGVASISKNGEYAEIYKLYIIPSCRRKKYGKALLDESIKFLKESGVNEIFIEAVGNSYEFWGNATCNYKSKKYCEDKFSIIIGA